MTSPSPVGASTSSIQEVSEKRKPSAVVEVGSLRAPSSSYEMISIFMASHVPSDVDPLTIMTLDPFVGTGGVLSAASISTSPPVQDVSSLEEGLGTPWLEPVSEMLSFIQSALSLNVSQLADVLRVQRPTIYSWMRDESEPKHENQERILSLRGISQSWTELEESPLGRRLTFPLLDGRSLIDLLREEPLRGFAIKRSLRRLLALPPDKKKWQGSKSFAKSHDLKVDPYSREAEDRLSFVTGKRSTND